MRNRRFLVPKITQAELNGRISKTLAALGAAHHIQAVFFSRVALETLARVISSLQLCILLFAMAALSHGQLPSKL
jgi:hypothetical protein